MNDECKMPLVFFFAFEIEKYGKIFTKILWQQDENDLKMTRNLADKKVELTTSRYLCGRVLVSKNKVKHGFHSFLHRVLRAFL